MVVSIFQKCLNSKWLLDPIKKKNTPTRTSSEMDSQNNLTIHNKKLTNLSFSLDILQLDH